MIFQMTSIKKYSLFVISVGMISWSNSVLLPQTGSTSGVIDLGDRMELFTDNYLIYNLVGIEIRMQIPVDEGPVLYFINPWEGIFSGYSTIIKDDSIYRLYYRGIPAIGGDGSDQEVTCYAESTDGINWVKPELGLYKVNSSWKNNVILANAAPVSLILNFSTSAAGYRKRNCSGGQMENRIGYLRSGREDN